MTTLEPKISKSWRFSLGIGLISLTIFSNLASTVWGAQLLQQAHPLSAFTVVYFNVSFDVLCFLPALLLPSSFYSVRFISARSLLLTFLYQIGNILYFLAVPSLGLSTVTIIFQSSSIWVFLFSVCILDRQLSLFLIFAVILCFSGVLIIALDFSSHNKFISMLFLLASSVLWGAYEVLQKLFFKHGNEKDFLIFIGFRGLFNLLFWWPPVLLQTDRNFYVSRILLWMAALSVLQTLGYTLSIGYTSPLLVRTGTTIAVPLSFLYDILVNHKHVLTIRIFLGTMSILTGFFFVLSNEKSRNCINEASVKVSRQPLLDSPSIQNY